MSPASAATKHTYFSIPRQGETNGLKRWFTLDVQVPKEATVTGVRFTLRNESGAQLQQSTFNVGDKTNLKVENGGRKIGVLVTMHQTPTTFSTAPPPTHGLRYEFVVEATQAGQNVESKKKDVVGMNALWRMPARFDGHRFSTPIPGHSDWTSKAAYEWMDANASLVTRINRISGEHGKSLGRHKSHATGVDIDMFHYYNLPGGWTDRDIGEGMDNYNKLAKAVVAWWGGDTGAEVSLQNWILATRAGLDGLLATGQVRIVIYALGIEYVEGTVTLPEGWARSLIKTGKLTIGTKTMDTKMGAFGRASDGRLLYWPDHGDHIHVSLSVK